MKPDSGNILPLICLALALAFCSAQAVTLTVTPNIVTTGFSGTLTLQIKDGLNPGETVVVERFVDLNGNGLVDEGEPLTLSVRLTDGQATVIGGITNINIPRDLDTIAAEITARVVFGEKDRFAGKQIFRVSSPVERFAPEAAILTIKNVGLAQSISGVVRSGGTNVPHAFVALWSTGEDDDLVAGAIADGSGNFTITAPPANYEIAAVKHGYVTSEGPEVNLGAGASLTQNLELVSATRVISGRVVDAADSGIGLPGVDVSFESEDAFTTTFTDSNGNFSAPVTADEWEIEVEGAAMEALGYLEKRQPDADTRTENVSGLELALPKVSALLYGYLKDSAGNSISGVEMNSNRENVNGSEGYTDENGYYVVGVTAGDWWIVPSQEDLGDLGFSAQGTNVTLSAGEAVRIDFTAVGFSAYLNGRVLHQNGNPIANIGMNANKWSGGGWTSTETDANGNFRLGVFAGTWNVQLNSWDAEERGLVGPYLTFEVSDGVDISNIVYVARSVTASISGSVQQTNGSPVSSVGVFAYTTIDGTNYNVHVFTDGGGNYSLGVFNGTWSVGVSSHDLYQRGLSTPEGQTAGISNANATVNFTASPIGPLEITTTSLPEAAVGVYYSVNIEASGGVPPYSFAFTPDSDGLPPGMFFGGTGVLSGTPQFEGTTTFTIRVYDWAGNIADQTLSLTVINEGTPVLQVTTASLPAGARDTFYNVQLSASGGQPPYAWSLSPGSAALPAGLSLNTTGVLSGTPTVSGTFIFSVRATDDANATDDQMLSLVITAEPPVPAKFSVTAVTNGQFRLVLNGSGGSYLIEYSTNLTDWTFLTTAMANGDEIDLVASDNHGFYRAQKNEADVAFGSSVSFSSPVFYVTATNQNQNAIITVKRSGSLSNTVCLEYSVSDGTARAGQDYSPVSGNLCFEPGASTMTFPIPVFQNTGNQEKTVRVRLRRPDQSILLNTVLIIRGGAGESSFAFDQSLYRVRETDGQVIVTVLRSGDISGSATVNFSTVSGTAWAGVDFTPIIAPVYFPPNVTNRSVTIPIFSDFEAETNETATLYLSDPFTLQAIASATLEIIEPKPRIALNTDNLTLFIHPECADDVGHFTISNVGEPGSVLSYEATDSANKLSVSPWRQTIPAGSSILVDVYITNREIGQTTINVFDPRAQNTNQTVQTTLVLTNDLPVLWVSTNLLKFECGSAELKTLTVSNIGPACSGLFYTITSDAGWLSVSPIEYSLSGSSGWGHTVSANTTNLPVGEHSATLTLSAPEINLTTNITVSIDVCGFSIVHIEREFGGVLSPYGGGQDFNFHTWIHNDTALFDLSDSISATNISGDRLSVSAAQRLFITANGIGGQGSTAYDNAGGSGYCGAYSQFAVTILLHRAATFRLTGTLARDFNTYGRTSAGIGGSAGLIYHTSLGDQGIINSNSVHLSYSAQVQPGRYNLVFHTGTSMTTAGEDSPYRNQSSFDFALEVLFVP